jgi:D-glutamate cyclase
VVEPDGRSSLAAAIDHLMTVDVPGRGFIAEAYRLARARTGRPLIQEAGERLLAALALRRPPIVFLVTGATSQRVGLPDHIGEMDGPPGTIALARTLALAHGAVPVLLTDPGQGAMLSQAAASLGLYTLPVEQVRRQAAETTHAASVAVVEVPDQDASAREQAVRLVTDLSPVAAIAIEKAGKNERGVFHNSQKVDTSPGKARVDELFLECRTRGVLTIGIGDGGNEIGMGSIREGLVHAFPHMAKCICPCGGSILAGQETDCLITATVSNWGAYALAAYLAFAAGQPHAAHSAARERRLLEGAARAGYMHLDGLCVPAADGLPTELHESFVRLLAAMVHWPPLLHGRRGYLADMLPA